MGEDLASGVLRAGTVKNAKELLSGIKVQGRVGDFKIYNERVAFTIAGAPATNGYSPFGGELLDGQGLDLPPTHDTWPVIVAQGKGTLAPVALGNKPFAMTNVVAQGKGTLAPVALGNKPFAMTNPIYLDVDGNGRYDPPMSF